eukprot:CAMPEP_0183367572 /NCGR_PEP_ID=MMETSP0164_2-20130417/92957_1 /TAXON_ID=221442 /ORGANISM="Coccolithus pelagicus ssp braarudi, Strain PLY182g" /LENGTH=65 /DNA_ID=CAMNT_0025543527 /DNA_START=124 /DNA_END=317 /DNA_ORIENTATION=-
MAEVGPDRLPSLVRRRQEDWPRRFSLKSRPLTEFSPGQASACTLTKRTASVASARYIVHHEQVVP